MDDPTMVLIETAAGAPQTSSALLRKRVIRATRALIATSGLYVSMDQIAEAADVGRRSLFRHFKSRDALVGEVLDSTFRWHEDQLDAAADSFGPLAQWLPAVLRRTHQSHLAAGRGLWQLASAFDDELPPEFSAANRRRRSMRRRMTQRIADRAWISAGETSSTPQMLVEAMAIVISSFTTHSMTIDRKRSTESYVRTSMAILMAVITTLRADTAAQTQAS